MNNMNKLIKNTFFPVFLLFAVMISGYGCQKTDDITHITNSTEENIEDVAPHIFSSIDDLRTYVLTENVKDGDYLDIETVLKGQDNLINNLTKIQVQTQNKAISYQINGDPIFETFNYQNDDPLPRGERIFHFDMTFEEAIKTRLGADDTINHHIARNIDGREISYTFLYFDDQFIAIRLFFKVRRFGLLFYINVNNSDEDGAFEANSSLSPLITKLFTDGEERDDAVRTIVRAIENEIPPIPESDAINNNVTGSDLPETD